MNALMVEARGVRKHFGSVTILKGVDLQVECGSVTCLIGPSGSGKTTFLRCINHLENVDSGRLYVDGELIGYEERNNRLYELKFLHNLLRRFRRKATLFPHAYDRNRATGIRSLREFDDRITALYSGFTSADDYYNRAAATRVLDRIAVPTLILHALDDPFVRLSDESREKMNANPNITLMESRHGGHCAFLAEPDGPSGYDGYWAEHTLLRFLVAHA